MMRRPVILLKLTTQTNYKMALTSHVLPTRFPHGYLRRKLAFWLEEFNLSRFGSCFIHKLMYFRIDLLIVSWGDWTNLYYIQEWTREVMLMSSLEVASSSLCCPLLLVLSSFFGLWKGNFHLSRRSCQFFNHGFYLAYSDWIVVLSAQVSRFSHIDNLVAWLVRQHFN